MSARPDGPLEVLEDFEGCSIGPWRWDDDVLRVELREEPLVHADGQIHDYSLHFVFGLRNSGDLPASATVTVNWERAGKLTAVPTRLYVSDSPGQEFTASGVTITAQGRKRFDWTVNLGPGETLYWSNTLWRPYSYLQGVIPDMAVRAGLTAQVYGRSIQERELVAYWKPDAPGASDRPLVLVTCGFHPVEGDTLGADAILEWLADGGRDALKDVNLVLVPIANPDGFAQAYNGCNAVGVNFFWDFRRDDEADCPEAYHLWRLARRMPPVVYLDFHSYSVQGSVKHAGPYVQSQRAYWGDTAKNLSRLFSDALKELPNTMPKPQFAPSTFASQLTAEMNTITFAKYHLHQDLGRDDMKRLALDVFKRILGVVVERRVSASTLLTRPYGNVGKDVYGRIEQFAYRARYSYYHKARTRLARLLRVAQ